MQVLISLLDSIASMATFQSNGNPWNRHVEFQQSPTSGTRFIRKTDSRLARYCLQSGTPVTLRSRTVPADCSTRTRISPAAVLAMRQGGTEGPFGLGRHRVIAVADLDELSSPSHCNVRQAHGDANLLRSGYPRIKKRLLKSGASCPAKMVEEGRLALHLNPPRTHAA